MVSVTPRPLFTPGKDPLPCVQEAVLYPGPVWTGAENLAPHRDSIPGPPSPQPVAIPTELHRSTRQHHAKFPFFQKIRHEEQGIFCGLLGFKQWCTSSFGFCTVVCVNSLRAVAYTLRTLLPIYRTGVPLHSGCCILYIYIYIYIHFSTNISTEYFKHAALSPFFSSKCCLFHNANFFGSCIIHILRTGCATI